jgi:hypothetical protein
MLFIVLGKVNKYPQCSCISVYFGSTVILLSVHMTYDYVTPVL